MVVCADLGWLYSLSLLSLGVTLVVIGIAYALGQLLSNPQFNVWAKTEIYQVFITFFVVLLVIFLNDSFCHFKYSDLQGLAVGGSGYSYPEIGGDDNVMDASGKYLANVANFIKTSMKADRSIYGIAEEASRYSRTPCMPAATFCLYGTSGYSVRTFSGESSWIQIMGFSLYTDTVSYITVLVQMALLAFISGGGIMVYLPMAIVLRSLPMMRQLGGGLLAMCIALFIIYPGLVTIESLFWNPYAIIGYDWDTLTTVAGAIDYSFEYVSSGDYASNMATSLTLAGAMAALDLAAAIAVALSTSLVMVVLAIVTAVGNYVDSAELASWIQVSMQATSISFLSATFLFSLNIIAIGASARELGRLLGQEVDLSRLMQVV